MKISHLLKIANGFLHNQKYHPFCFPIQPNITGVKPTKMRNSPLSPEKMSSIPHYGFSRFPIPSPLVFPFSTWFQINCNQEDQIFWYTGLALTPFLLRRKKFITGTIHSMSYFISLPKGKKNLVLLKWTCYLKDKRSLKDSGLKRIWLQQHTPIDVIFMSVYFIIGLPGYSSSY